MARPLNQSSPVSLSVSLPKQTHAYLVELASVGALGQSEHAVASLLLINEVERLMKEKRAEAHPGAHGLKSSD